MKKEEREKWLEGCRVLRKEAESLILEAIDSATSGSRIVLNKFRQKLYDEGDGNAHMRLTSSGPHILKNHPQVCINEQGYYIKK